MMTEKPRTAPREKLRLKIFFPKENKSASSKISDDDVNYSTTESDQRGVGSEKDSRRGDHFHDGLNEKGVGSGKPDCLRCWRPLLVRTGQGSDLPTHLRPLEPALAGGGYR